MHWQLPPNLPKQLVLGIQWVHTGTRHVVVDTSSKVALHRFESHMLAIGACVDSDSPFLVTVIMNRLFLCCLKLCLPRGPFGSLSYFTHFNDCL